MNQDELFQRLTEINGQLIAALASLRSQITVIDLLRSAERRLLPQITDASIRRRVARRIVTRNSRADACTVLPARDEVNPDPNPSNPSTD